jgi:hypothetical protein
MSRLGRIAMDTGPIDMPTLRQGHDATEEEIGGASSAAKYVSDFQSGTDGKEVEEQGALAGYVAD